MHPAGKMRDSVQGPVDGDGLLSLMVQMVQVVASIALNPAAGVNVAVGVDKSHYKGSQIAGLGGDGVEPAAADLDDHVARGPLHQRMS